MYVTAIMNHLRTVRQRIFDYGGHASIDISTFYLEVKAKNRYFTLYPQFRARLNGMVVNVREPGDHTTGFLGWVPYRPIRWEISSNKIAFKNFISKAGFSTPSWWQCDQAPTVAFIIKSPSESFGRSISGPYSKKASITAEQPVNGSEKYLEEFVEGENIKIWVWGKTIFHSHFSPYSAVVGDGFSTIDELVAALATRQNPPIARPADDKEAMAACLAYQGYRQNDVLEKGISVWLDFRYGRGYASSPASEQEDNCLLRLLPQIFDQAELLVNFLSEELDSQFKVPVLYSVDGVVDRDGQVWWLEMNSNPTLPPTGYSCIFSTLFDS